MGSAPCVPPRGLTQVKRRADRHTDRARLPLPCCDNSSASLVAPSAVKLFPSKFTCTSVFLRMRSTPLSSSAHAFAISRGAFG